jgi:hypothetical protein
MTTQCILFYIIHPPTLICQLSSVNRHLSTHEYYALNPQPLPLPLLLHLHSFTNDTLPAIKASSPTAPNTTALQIMLADKFTQSVWDSAVQETTTANDTVAPKLHQGFQRVFCIIQPLGSFFVLFGQAKRTTKKAAIAALHSSQDSRLIRTPYFTFVFLTYYL